jgi:predicted nucleic acid-binding protein
MFLLDTNVVSETAKRRPNVGVMNWLEGTSAENLWICAISVGEIIKGIARLRQSDAARANQLMGWWTNLEAAYTDRILPFDASTARRWGELRAHTPNMSVEDSLIASIALAKGFTLVTRNIRDFTPAGVPLLNPFD